MQGFGYQKAKNSSVLMEKWSVIGIKRHEAHVSLVLAIKDFAGEPSYKLFFYVVATWSRFSDLQVHGECRSADSPWS